MKVDFQTLITNVRLKENMPLVSIGINAGYISYLGENQNLQATTVIDGGGALAMPGLVEPHAHLDKTYTINSLAVEGKENSSALRHAINLMGQIKISRSLQNVEGAVRRAIERALSFGVCHIRSHLDLSGPSDFLLFEMLLALRAEYASRIRLEFTALASLQTEQEIELAHQALAMGVDCIGAAPALADDPEGVIDNVFELAKVHGCSIDLHIDETEDPDSGCLEYLANKVIASQWQGKVMASHCCSLAFQSEADRARVIEKVAQAGIYIVTLPACNLVLMGRNMNPMPRGVTPVAQLIAAGVNVCAGSDNIRDPFHPLGDYDPLQTAAISAEVSQLDNVKLALDMVSTTSAGALGIQDYGLAEGCEANLFLIMADNFLQALAERPVRSHVFFKGKLVLEQKLQQTWNTEHA